MNRSVISMPVLATVVAAAMLSGNRATGQVFPGAGSESEAANGVQLPPPEEPDDVESGPLLPPANRDARPYLGITFDPEFRDAAVVDSIIPGSPAEEAGLQPGDTVDAINDEPVGSFQDMVAIMEELQPGEIIDIDFSRRISARTQAVLDESLEEDSRLTAGVAPESRDDLYREPPAALPAEPQLPQRRYTSERAYLRRVPVDNSDRLAPRRYYVVEPVEREDRNERVINRLRGVDRGSRSRPLLPWRRN